MTIKVVFFDIDDTLVDHATAMRRATVALHASVAPGTGLDEFLLSWKGAHARHYPRFLRGEVTYAESARARVRDAIGRELPANEADAIFTRYLADYERGWTLFPDVISCLDALHDMSLGVISNGRSDEQRRKLTKLGIAGRFPCVCVSEDIGVAKPDSRIFELACARAGVEASDALYVGD
jgi:putative hydrolase of the HAD superfamily